LDPNFSYVAPFFIETVNAHGSLRGTPERRKMIAAVNGLSGEEQA